MFWIVSMFLALVVFTALFLIGRYLRNSEDPDEQDRGPRMQIIGFAVLIVWVVLHTFLASIHIVNAGYVGVVYELGAIVGQRSEGLQFTSPWQNMNTWDVRVQKIRPETKCFDTKIPECLEAFSFETQDVFIVPTVNLSVSPEDIQFLARRVGPDYVDKLVRPRLNQIFKDTTVAYKSVDTAPHREDIRATVKDRLREELAIYSIKVEDLLIDNMDFRPEFKKAIEDKQIAHQEALRQEELVAARQAEARQLAASAQGTADKLRIEAQGQADANRAINESLTPTLIQWQAVQKLGPNVQIALIPSGQGVIIDPTTLLGKLQQPTEKTP